MDLSAHERGCRLRISAKRAAARSQKKNGVFFPSDSLRVIEIAPGHIYTPPRIAAIVEQARGSIPLSPRNQAGLVILGALV